MQTCSIVCSLIVVCLKAGSGAPWQPQDESDCHDRSMRKVPLCRKTSLAVLFLQFCRRPCHASFPNDVAARMTWHIDQFVVEAAAPIALMLTMMLIIPLSEGYHQLLGTKPYVFLGKTQPTTNPQRPLTHHDLNGRQRPPWCLTPGAHPKCWQIVKCNGYASGAPWQPWDDGDRQGQRGTVQPALASFYQAKTHITTHNNQSIRPTRRCADNNIIAGHEYLDDYRQPLIGNTIVCLLNHLSLMVADLSCHGSLVYKVLISTWSANQYHLAKYPCWLLARGRGGRWETKPKYPTRKVDIPRN